MKITKIKAPFTMLIAIGDRGSANNVEQYLNENKYFGGIVFMGKGTAESDIADIFGFGISDRDIIACLIPVENKEKIIKDINKITGVETDRYGLNFVIDLQSASSNLLEILK